MIKMGEMGGQLPGFTKGEKKRKGDFIYIYIYTLIKSEAGVREIRGRGEGRKR